MFELKIDRPNRSICSFYDFYKNGMVHFHGLETEVCDMPFEFDHIAATIALPHIHDVIAVGANGKYHHHIFKGSLYLKALFDFMDGEGVIESDIYPDINGLTYNQLPNIARGIFRSNLDISEYNLHSNETEKLLKVVKLISPNCIETIASIKS